MYLGYTSLIYSSKGGHHNVVSILLEHGANVNATDYNGKIVDIIMVSYLIYMIFLWELLWKQIQPIYGH